MAEIERAALHEAGHAIAYCYYSYGFSSAEIEPKTGKGKCDGAIHFREHRLSASLPVDGTRVDVSNRAFCEMIIILAGAASERRHWRPSCEVIRKSAAVKDFEEANE